MAKKYRNITETIVANDLCIGCGVCAAVCPPSVLDMRFNNNAEYVATEFRDGCLPKCDLCFRACPFVDGNDDEDTLGELAFGKVNDINHHKDAGYYLGSFVGHTLATEQRLNSSSGGLTRWFLLELLRKNIVDHIICVFPNDDPEKLFKYSSVANSDEIANASHSSYYPVELSEQLRTVISHEGRYAIIGLPCYIKAIKLAMKKSKRLNARIKLTAALVCGQTKSKYYAQYLTALGGGEHQTLQSVNFREKDAARSANDFGFHFTCKSGDVKEKTINWSDGVGKAYTRGYFKPNACNFCDDIFGELADVSFMDAWVNPYMDDYRGTNFILTRNREIENIFMEARTQKEIVFDKIDFNFILESQRGVINLKKHQLGYRLSLARIMGRKHVPHKRISPSRFAPYRLIQTMVAALYAPLSKYLFRLTVKRSNTKHSLIIFHRYMSVLYFFHKVVNYLEVLLLRFTKMTGVK